MMNPKGLFNIVVKLIGAALIIYILNKLMNITSYGGYSGLNLVVLLYILSMLMLGVYLLKNNNWFSLIGNSAFLNNEYTIRNIILFILKLIGMILIVIQINSLLDFLQFIINAKFYGLNNYILSVVSSVVFLLLGIALLLYGRTRNNRS